MGNFNLSFQVQVIEYPPSHIYNLSYTKRANSLMFGYIGIIGERRTFRPLEKRGFLGVSCKQFQKSFSQQAKRPVSAVLLLVWHATILIQKVLRNYLIVFSSLRRKCCRKQTRSKQEANQMQPEANLKTKLNRIVVLGWSFFGGGAMIRRSLERVQTKSFAREGA